MGWGSLAQGWRTRPNRLSCLGPHKRPVRRTCGRTGSASVAISRKEHGRKSIGLPNSVCSRDFLPIWKTTYRMLSTRCFEIHCGQRNERLFDSAGRDPDPAQLFKLVFWLLTAKVFRGAGAFRDWRSSSARMKKNRSSRLREAIRTGQGAKAAKSGCPRSGYFANLARSFDFRNLSVDVLSQIWATTRVDDETKKRLGIHRTPRTESLDAWLSEFLSTARVTMIESYWSRVAAVAFF